MRRDVFQAISDPTRREILNLLAHERLNLNAVADQFDVSRPAISRHIKILTECGLVQIRQQGRERYCEAQLSGLSEVVDWLAHYRAFWTQKLDALGEFLEQAESPEPKNKKAQKHLLKNKRK